MMGSVNSRRAADGRTPTGNATPASGVAHGAPHRLASLATFVALLYSLAACASVERTRINDWIELEQSAPRVIMPHSWAVGDAYQLVRIRIDGTWRDLEPRTSDAIQICEFSDPRRALVGSRARRAEGEPSRSIVYRVFEQGRADPVARIDGDSEQRVLPAPEGRDLYRLQRIPATRSEEPPRWLFSHLSERGDLISSKRLEPATELPWLRAAWFAGYFRSGDGGFAPVLSNEGNQWLLGDAPGHGATPGLRTPNCAGHLGDD